MGTGGEVTANESNAKEIDQHQKHTNSIMIRQIIYYAKKKNITKHLQFISDVKKIQSKDSKYSSNSKTSKSWKKY